MKRNLILAAAVGTLALAAPAAFAGDRHDHGRNDWNRGHHNGWHKHNHRPVVVKQKVVYRDVHRPMAYGYRPFYNPPRPLAYYPAPRPHYQHPGLTLAFNF